MNFLSILPEFVLFLGALTILMVDVFCGKKLTNPSRISYLLAIIFTISSLILVIDNYDAYFGTFNFMFYSNRFSSYVKIGALILLLAVIFISGDFLKRENKISSEFIALLMIATTGSMILISSNDLLTFYLALELQSLPLYILAAIKNNSRKSSEAGIKYFILGSVASGILLLGISMIYGFTGTTNFDALYNFITNTKLSIGLLFGLTLVLIAILFKVSAAPFHMWAPDVYEGSATLVTTFFASVIKFTSALVLVRVYASLVSIWPSINQVLILVATLSLLFGSLAAIRQSNLKRLLAYSGIGHIGFVLAALAATSFDSIKSSIFYMTIYSTLALGSFAALLMLENKKKSNDEDADADQSYQISSLAGIAKTNPAIAAAITILMFSLAGIPPMAGFFAKFYVLLAIVKKEIYYLAIIAILASVISAFYYLRIVKIMYFDSNENNPTRINTDNLNIVAVLIAAALLNILFVLLVSHLNKIITNLI